ncbi:MAG: hypothetical protein J2P36_06060 [Ktedonobacteraceae bacterium]|nr:hypothetical protein [Ktedonobacteraceae bacterium]
MSWPAVRENPYTFTSDTLLAALLSRPPTLLRSYELRSSGGLRGIACGGSQNK